MSKDPKFATNSNDQNMQDSKQASLGSGVLDFLELIYLSLSLFRISIFGFRIFFRRVLGAINFVKLVLFNNSIVRI